MIFDSASFLFTFLPLVILIYYAVPQKMKNGILLIASLIFYAWGEPIYIIVMIGCILFNYLFGLIIDRIGQMASVGKKSKLKPICLLIAITANLVLLIAFKYSSFFTNTLNDFFNTKLIDPRMPLLLGISFFTFTNLSYIIDIYRGKIKPQKNLINFAMYISLFPQINSGLIVRYSDIENEINYRKTDYNKMADGISQFILGLAKKLIIADSIGSVWISVKAINYNEMPALTAWFGIIALAFQLYYSFSGYSDMAIGLLKMFGFTVPKNFDHPFASKSISELFSRWNITLMSWFKDYVYIPLRAGFGFAEETESLVTSRETLQNGNGKKQKSTIKTIICLILVWLLIGLWHGGSWNFIIWGLYIASIIICEKFVWGNLLQKLPKFFRWLYTFAAAVLSLVIFAIPIGTGATSFYKALFALNNIPLANNETLFLLFSKIAIFCLCIFGVSKWLEKALTFLKAKFPRVYAVSKLFIEVIVFIICICYLINS